MAIAAIIPLMIAPAAYVFVAKLTLRLEEQATLLDCLAHRDTLTGLANRRGFVDKASAMLNDHIPKGKFLIMVVADLDHFKRINDAFGHATGDLALAHAADLLRGASPTDALIGRLGGEEFGLLYFTQQSDWTAQADAIRRHLFSIPLKAPPEEIALSGSFGVALSHRGESLDSLLKRADIAMYRAKSDGRNRVVAAA